MTNVARIEILNSSFTVMDQASLGQVLCAFVCAEVHSDTSPKAYMLAMTASPDIIWC